MKKYTGKVIRLVAHPRRLTLLGDDEYSRDFHFRKIDIELVRKFWGKKVCITAHIRGTYRMLDMLEEIK